MTLNTFKCNCLTPLRDFKGLSFARILHWMCHFVELPNFRAYCLIRSCECNINVQYAINSVYITKQVFGDFKIGLVTSLKCNVNSAKTLSPPGFKVKQSDNHTPFPPYRFHRRPVFFPLSTKSFQPRDERQTPQRPNAISVCCLPLKQT